MIAAQLDLFADYPAPWPAGSWLVESQDRSRIARQAFDAALALGPAPAPWFGATCSVCSSVMWLGDIVVRSSYRKSTRVVHQRCSGGPA